MPSLRERSSRPSYALISEGLDDLSDQDEFGAEGSGSAMKRTPNNAASPSSSGGSGEHGPARRMTKKPMNGKGKGKGKAKAVAADDSGSDFQAASEEEEDDDHEMEVDEAKEGGYQEEEEDEAIVELVDDDDGEDMMDRKKASTSGKGSNTKNWTGPRSAQAAYIQTEANMIPPAYRALIKRYAEELAPPIRGSTGPIAKDFRSRALDYDMLPFGPNTPFITRLRNPPSQRGVDEVYVVPGKSHDEDWEKRKPDRTVRSSDVVRNVTVIEPWQTWQGEGWWPEMATPVGDTSVGPSAQAGPSKTSQKHGKKKKAATNAEAARSISTGRHEWKMRDEVRLGLDHVGRYRHDHMTFLRTVDAARYLPQTCLGLSDPSISVHMGPYGKQTKTQWQTFDSRPHSDFSSTYDGAVFCAGGPIWGLDWCPYPSRESAKHDGVQYLAVSPMPNLEYKPILGSKQPKKTPGCIQIWGMVPALVNAVGNATEPNRMRCELVLCVEGGPALEIKWMPMGAWDAEGDRSNVPKLGILAACQLDGTVSLYAVPHPRYLTPSVSDSMSKEPLFVKAQPLLKLEVADAACTTIEWINGSRIACGTSTGHIVAWDVVETMKDPSLGSPLPAMYLCVAQSSVKSIAIGRVPTKNDKGSYDYTGDPISIVAGCYDGTAQYIDLRDPNCIHEIISTRMPIMGIAWSNQLAVPVWADAEHVVQLHNVGLIHAPRSYYFAVHRGPIWSVSTSDYHTMVLSASADGSVSLTNLHSGWFRRRGAGMTYQRLFEMDYDNHSGEYRMVDNFAVEDISLDYANQKNMNKSKSSSAHSLEGNPIVIKTGNWSPHVGVHRSCWNNNGGLGKAGWIASGTASGLGRVDIVHGRFVNDRIPPGF